MLNIECSQNITILHIILIMRSSLLSLLLSLVALALHSAQQSIDGALSIMLSNPIVQ